MIVKLRAFFYLHVLLGVALPLAPTILEWLVLTAFPKLGEFELIGENLVVTAMMFPLVGILTEEMSDSKLKWVFVSSLVCGIALFILSVVFSSPVVKPTFPGYDHRTHLAAAIVVGLSIPLILLCRGVIEFSKATKTAKTAD